MNFNRPVFFACACAALFFTAALSACTKSAPAAAAPVVETAAAPEEPVLPPQVQPAPSAVKTPSPAAANDVAPAQMSPQEKAVAGLKSWDTQLLSLKTGFDQTSSYDGTEVSRSSGVLYFSKPNKIRLESLNAAGKITQITLTDKNKIKIFDASMNPVQTYNWKDWFESQPNKAFFDFGNYSALLKTNDVTNFKDNKNGTVTLTLEPPARDQKIFITMPVKNYFPSEISLVVEDMVTVTTLKDTQINQPLPDGIFKGL